MGCNRILQCGAAEGITAASALGIRDETKCKQNGFEVL